MIANILNANNVPIVEKGNNTLLFLIPGIAKVLRVTSKLVKETVVLTPANTTLIAKISCAPTPVYLVQEENGVIKVQPAVTRARLEHFVK